MNTPLHVIIAKLSGKPLSVQCDELTRLVAAEKLHSGRRAELQALLYNRRQREIRHLNRTKGKGWAACAPAP
jgi:hypothetical protein